MNKKDYEIKINELINADINKIKQYTVTINDDKPLFSKEDFEIIEGIPKYFELDKYGRSNGAIAVVSPNTIPLIKKKKLKYPEPSYWNQAFENRKLFEKCHIIAYSLSAKIAVTNNIFIGTVKLNRSYMKKVENEIEKYVKDNSVKVLYKVTVKYKGEDKIPIGVLIEAQSIDDDFCVCKFCYNIQKGRKFRYSDGLTNREKFFLAKVVETVQDKAVNQINKTSNRKTYINYSINTKTHTFHLYDEKCKDLDTVEPKYIQETTVTEKDLLNKSLKQCKKCVK